MRYFKCVKFEKRIKSALSVVVFLFSAVTLCSCNFSSDGVFFDNTTKPVKTTSESATQPKVQREVDTSYSYDNLSSDKLKELYVLIDQYAENADKSEIIIDAQLDEQYIEETIEAYKNDHPEVFWLSSTFYYTENPSDNNTIIQLEYNMDSSKLESAKPEFENALKVALDGAPDDATDYELELYANDYLVDNCVYDKEAVESKEILGNENDAYGALVDKKAVCEGYSRAFQLLCNRLGIDCINIAGTADGVAHAWNNVMLDGEWYEVDVTWNDTDGETEFPIYGYFNLPSDKFSESHNRYPLYSEISSSEYDENTDSYYNVFAPECTGTKYYYYSYSCVTVDDVNDGEEITDAIAQAANDGQEYFSFLVDESLDFNTTADEIIFDGYLSQWVANANLANWYNPKLNEECYVYRNEEFNVITVILEYL